MLEKSCVLLATMILAFASTASAAEGMRWLSDGAQDLVVASPGYENVKAGRECWEGTVVEPGDPIIVLKPVEIDADKEKFLYVRMAAGRAARIHVYFSPHTGFSEPLSFQWHDVSDRDEPALYAFDLTSYEPWNGAIRSLRIDVDGASKGNAVRLYAVGVSEKLTEGATPLPITRTASALFDRMAAWHHTMVATDESRPNSCVSTYYDDRFTYDHSPMLAKLVTGVEVDGQLMWPVSARAVEVEDIPGGVVASYRLGDIQVTTEIVPLMIGRDTSEWDGAALYSVKTDPATPVAIKCGSGGVSSHANPRMAILRKDGVGFNGDSVEIEGNLALLKSSQHAFSLAVKGSGVLEREKEEHGGEYLLARLPEGSGHLLIAFAKDTAEAKETAAVNVTGARAEVKAYYDKLLQCRIETPEKVIDDAFRTALYNLEYNWIKPYGWNECIHHWLALWHMQHTAAAEWIGQTDRSRDCNVVTAENLLGDGSVPQFVPAGMTRKDFGGSNQFFAWQVRHYWNFTGDKETIELIAPKLDRVIAQTFAEYDPDNDGLLAWSQQIGNQEDYISTPFNGTSPTVEGINMLRTAATFAASLGNKEKADMYNARADEALSRLRSELWLRDLGRFAFYKDPSGLMRPDGQYHTLIYPVIWDVLDPLDSWTSIRHMRDRLMGKDGETYCSNNFPNHVVATVGTQAGAAQQPWAAWGLAAVGLRNETYRPLKAVSEWAMNANHRGAWPEVSTEPTPSYFSPPAGLLVQSTIEALFGLEVNRPEGLLKISPSFPDHWPSAKLNLPDFSAEYARTENTLDYTVTSSDSLARRVRWMLPPCKVTKVLVDGRKAKFEVAPGVNCVVLSLDTPPSRRTRFTVSIAPIKYEVAHPKSIAEGQELALSASGCVIERVDDRSGILSSVQVSGADLRGVIQEGLLAPYSGFGRLGQLNFSRRTFFLLCNTENGASFWVPIDLTILPDYEVCAQSEIDESGKFRLLVRNNTESNLKGTAYLSAARQRIPLAVDVPARSEKEYAASLPKNLLALLSPGDNAASLLLPGARDIRFTITASEVYNTIPQLRDYAAARMVQIPLPENLLRPDTEWNTVRNYYCYGHMPWGGSRPPLEALGGKHEVTVPDLPAVSFKLQERKFIPLSNDINSPTVSIDLGSSQYKKLYLLVVPLLDNHDTFTPVARIDVKGKDGALISKTLHYPGDLDCWSPQELVGDYSTARHPRPDRLGLLPMLGPAVSDWKEGVPPAFPQPELWATCLPLKTPTAVMNAIEIDLGRPVQVKSLSLSVLSANAAFGLVAISAEQPGGMEFLTDTDLLPPAQYRESRVIFEIAGEKDLEGWRLEGEAFSVAPYPGLFEVPTLNSLAKAGETATGKAISPSFSIGKDDTTLDLQLQGGNSEAEEGPGSLTIRLVDADSGELLYNLQVKGSHTLREGRIEVAKWRGRSVRLELVDESSKNSFAWLGLRSVKLRADGGT